MSDRNYSATLNRRDVLRNGAAVGGGLLASALAAGTAAATDGDTGDEGATGYISRSSYRALTGSENVDCVPETDGWGGTFYVEGPAEDSGGDTGVSVRLPDTCDGDGDGRQHPAYTVTADEHVELAGGPNGHGPWGQPCGSWLFVGEGDTLEPGTVYRVSTASGPESPTVCHEGVTASDGEGTDIGAPMDLVRVSFERASPGAQWTERRKLTGDGSAVGIDGPTAVVGPAADGPAAVFARRNGDWTRDSELGQSDDIVGSPALSGDTVLFSGPVADDTQNRPVHVYTRLDGDWQKQTTLRPEDLDPGARFGASYDIDGETLVVGAPEARGANDRSRGVVYVYTRSDGNWELEATLEDTRDIPDTADGLGYDVAVDGDTILGGAPYAIYYAFGFSSVGGALVFSRADDEWSREAFLRSDNPDDEDFQGESVALEGDTAVIASSRAGKDSGAEYAGTAWVFTRDGSAWRQQAKVIPTDWGRGDWFGSALSLDGDALLVGSNTRDRDANDASGAAYIFTREASTWRQLVRLTARDGGPRDQFGSSVALDGEFAFVGARGVENPDDTDGATYLFEQ